MHPYGGILKLLGSSVFFISQDGSLNSFDSTTNKFNSS